MKTTTYHRKSFPVEAVQVTLENMLEVREWTKGEIKTDQNKAAKPRYIYIPVRQALNERQQRAYVGDWVLRSGHTFRIYNDNAFRNSFELPPEVRIRQELSKAFGKDRRS